MTTRPQLQPVRGEPGRPLYELVRDAVRDAVDRGSFGPGERLPSTKALATTLEVSLVTVHRALQELVAAGVLRRGQGRGTFVHESYAEPSHRTSTMRVGIVFHTEASLADSYHGQIMEGVRRGAEDIGADIVLLRYGEDWRNECQGYLYVNPFKTQLDHSPRFGRRPTPTDTPRQPTMVVGARTDVSLVGCVDTDNISLAEAAVQHLYDLGHRRISFLGGQSDLTNNIDRLTGYRNACRRLGLPREDATELCAQGWQLGEQDMVQLTDLLRSDNAPTAIFAAGYYFALNVYTAANRLGLRIPTDLSLIGVDDPPSAVHLSPALTTMRQPLVEVGKTAIRELQSQVKTGAAPARRTLDAELIIRESTARATDAQSRVTTRRAAGVKS
ncbi:MAG: GntR family transcriptional regulator [Phycisphaerales bacterium]|nr:GntR family transcriptional regulator [Planctomycetota bacterium]MCH8508328.1 GntR family transcriptional regulator [Phycisphaerales bacterium]